MKNWFLIVLSCATALLLVKLYFFPEILKDTVIDTVIRIERDSTWKERALTAEEKAASLEETIKSFKLKAVPISDIKYDTIKAMITDTLIMTIPEINIDYETKRGRDTVKVFADLYPSIGTVLWRAEWGKDYTQVVTNRITETNTVLKRLTWGVQVGGGLSTAGPALWLGLGVNFNLGGL